MESCAIGCLVPNCFNTTEFCVKIRKRCFRRGWDAGSILIPSEALGGSHSPIYVCMHCAMWSPTCPRPGCVLNSCSAARGFLPLGPQIPTLGLGHGQGLACNQCVTTPRPCCWPGSLRVRWESQPLGLKSTSQCYGEGWVSGKWGIVGVWGGAARDEGVKVGVRRGVEVFGQE